MLGLRSKCVHRLNFNALLQIRQLFFHVFNGLLDFLLELFRFFLDKLLVRHRLEMLMVLLARLYDLVELLNPILNLFLVVVGLSFMLH